MLPEHIKMEEGIGNSDSFFNKKKELIVISSFKGLSITTKTIKLRGVALFTDVRAAFGGLGLNFEC
jgi:hypothetical protein